MKIEGRFAVSCRTVYVNRSPTATHMHTDPHPCGNTVEKELEGDPEDWSQNNLPFLRPQQKLDDAWHDAQPTSREATIEPAERLPRAIWSVFREYLVW